MNTQDLIQNLSTDIQHVSPLKNYKRRFVELLTICLSVTVAGVIYWFIKKDELHFPTGRAFAEVLFLMASSLIFTFLATKSVTPHHSLAQFSKWSTFPIVFWLLLLLGAFIKLYFENSAEALVAFNYKTWLCPTVIFSIAIPIATISFVYLNRGWIHFPVSTFTYWSALSLGFGALGLAFICPWEDPLHEILWHALPVLLTIPIITVVTTLLFRLSDRNKKNHFNKMS
ncbi:MAG: DUF1109 family protein [Bdellovibrionaceae bacterium]|nr:DUF1109 family protein [Pseudobdellovibrionaceae bacterium]